MSRARAPCLYAAFVSALAAGCRACCWPSRRARCSACISGLLESPTFNVSEVISGIMLNWIALYTTNMLLTNVKEATSPYTYQLKAEGPQAILPQISLVEAPQRQPVRDHRHPHRPSSAPSSSGSFCQRRSSAMSSRPPATTTTPRNTAAWRKSATSSSRSPSAARWQAWALRFCTRRAMSSGSVPTPPSPRWASTASPPPSSAASARSAPSSPRSSSSISPPAAHTSTNPSTARRSPI